MPSFSLAANTAVASITRSGEPVFESLRKFSFGEGSIIRIQYPFRSFTPDASLILSFAHLDVYWRSYHALSFPCCIGPGLYMRIQATLNADFFRSEFNPPSTLKGAAKNG